jgi:O-antigen/teichoic acid export membrane protein
MSEAVPNPEQSPPVPDVFATDDLSRDLDRRSVQGGAAVIAGQAAVFLITLASTPVLARLLTPEDYGLLAMVGAITAFIGDLRNLGLPQATIQRSAITHAQISTLFWINAAAGLATAGLVVALAYPIAWFYDKSQLVGITLGLSLSFLFAGLAAQHQALLRRRMRFGMLAVIQIGATFVGAAAAITAAALGAQYWALVLLQVLTAAGIAVGVWTCCRWIPGPPVRDSGVRPMVRFGAYLAAGNILHAATRNVDKLLIGRVVGDKVLGLYGKASLLLLLPISQINLPVTYVAVPALSRLQNEPERFRAMYRRGIEAIAMMVAPIPIFIFFAAEPIILVLLGDKWVGAIPLSRALAPAALVTALGVSIQWVYVSLDRTDRQFRWLLFSAACVIAAFAVGIAWGALGVALAFSTVVWVLFIPAVIYCFHGTFMKYADLAEPIWRPCLAALVAGATVYFLERWLLDGFSPFLELPVVGVAFAVVHLIVLVVLPGGYTRVLSMFELRRHFRSEGALQE